MHPEIMNPTLNIWKFFQEHSPSQMTLEMSFWSHPLGKGPDVSPLPLYEICVSSSFRVSYPDHYVLITSLRLQTKTFFGWTRCVIITSLRLLMKTFNA